MQPWANQQLSLFYGKIVLKIIFFGLYNFGVQYVTFAELYRLNRVLECRGEDFKIAEGGLKPQLLLSFVTISLPSITALSNPFAMRHMWRKAA
jgi:hypothetical protein